MTIQEYIAERRKFLAKVVCEQGTEEYNRFAWARVEDAVNEMPRVLDMLEKAIYALENNSYEYFKEYTQRATVERDALEDIEKMVNE